MLSRSSAGPYMPLDMPMQPRPSGNTLGPLEPSRRGVVEAGLFTPGLYPRRVRRSVQDLRAHASRQTAVVEAGEVLQVVLATGSHDVGGVLAMIGGRLACRHLRERGAGHELREPRRPDLAHVELEP